MVIVSYLTAGLHFNSVYNRILHWLKTEIYRSPEILAFVHAIRSNKIYLLHFHAKQFSALAGK